MIEVPAGGAHGAGAIAEHADFFSFGTNDLTQMAYALSRDDASVKFLPDYLEVAPAGRQPLRLDRRGGDRGAGRDRGAARAGVTRPSGSSSACAGSTAAIAKSVRFCHRVGLDYVSCSPYRVPIARLAAAQAAVEGAVTRVAAVARAAALALAGPGARGLS